MKTSPTKEATTDNGPSAANPKLNGWGTQNQGIVGLADRPCWTMVGGLNPVEVLCAEAMSPSL
jgi:hypothetical protein